MGADRRDPRAALTAGSTTLPPAVLVDALGTLVELVDPFGSLTRELAARGVEVTADEARAALRAEMTYYRAHCHVAADADALAALRDRCVGVLRDALPDRVRGADPATLKAALLGALRFAAYPDAARALERWGAEGARIAVVSNWDVSLHDVLRDTGLDRHVDAVVTSAESGSSKPGPEIFGRALERLAARAEDAAHVGDTYDEDVAGARAAGVAPVLLLRDGGDPPGGVHVVRTLDALWPTA